MPDRCPGPSLAASGLAKNMGMAAGFIPVGMSSPPTAREVSLHHLMALLADHKSWKCLMRSLSPGSGAGPCWLPVEQQSKQVQAEKAIPAFLSSLWALPLALGRVGRASAFVLGSLKSLRCCTYS